ncbi:chemotaxis response regulator protein-glutamate methylesterase [Ligilactobacillus sp. WILCCON 0076]|uniref:Protein-glutamate methylesterase/protein-glutamine glutaminase n=1 Tax=Ligilactobacillus ubinensis TaxID=2876789 RepID=A0A9X2JKQ2_9LACO|nr:chemotaxis response regulator protein-glutamate methylesterase [Ligilactobacillus ubinensis]MCP0886229.1 chemotaxis response regulator protein-glutamate methylesterase [Ligilactobacillus ubinensis]
MIRILIVDDSAFMRKVITDLITKMPGIEVAGIARNGKNAIEFIEDDTHIDLVLMDVEMPIMDGLEALKIIKKTKSIPVVMLSALTNQAVTIEALELGATDFIEKPTNIMEIKDDWIRDFYNKIKGATGAKTVKARNSASIKISSGSKRETKSITDLKYNLKAIVIGASTGGPRALINLITALPANLRVPIIIVQHMPKGFTATFAERMDNEAKVTVKEAKDGELIQRAVYIAPGDFHMTIENNRLRLNQTAKQHGTRPAVDPLFLSAAQQYGSALIGIILTGMGKDGTTGLQQIQAKGGYTIAQDKDSCIVFGMPGNAIENNVIDEVLSLSEIRAKLSELVR